VKVIIAGGRNFTDYRTLCIAIKLSGFDNDYNITEVVSGKARGADTIGEIYATLFDIHIEPFPADWGGPNKKAAGFIRNQQMADYCEPEVDGLIAMWDGESRGTLDMITRAKKRKLKVFIYNYVERKPITL
jgi:hypothetical protein